MTRKQQEDYLPGLFHALPSLPQTIIPCSSSISFRFQNPGGTMVVARSKEGKIVSFSFRFLWGSWLRVFLQIFLVLFWLFLPSLASGAEEASSLPFETLYRWEPLSGGASLYPTSGPFRDEKLLAFSVRERVLVAVDLASGRVLFEKEYPEKCVVHAVRKGYVFFYLGSATRVFALAPRSGRELSFPWKTGSYHRRGVSGYRRPGDRQGLRP
jgi:hypothetical protein